MGARTCNQWFGIETLSFEPHQPDPVCVCGHGLSLHEPIPGNKEPRRGQCLACAERAVSGHPFPRAACDHFREQ